MLRFSVKFEYFAVSRLLCVTDSIVQTTPIGCWTEAAAYWKRKKPERRYVQSCRRFL